MSVQREASVRFTGLCIYQQQGRQGQTATGVAALADRTISHRSQTCLPHLIEAQGLSHVQHSMPLHTDTHTPASNVTTYKYTHTIRHGGGTHLGV